MCRRSFPTLCLDRTVIEVRGKFITAVSLALALSICSGCPQESQVSYLQRKGVEFSRPLTTGEVEALKETAPPGMHGITPYGTNNPEWRELKAKWRDGDYFLQFWSGEALVERTKFYADGIYLIRRGCVVGWVRGALS
jgi:hypothetical protein